MPGPVTGLPVCSHCVHICVCMFGKSTYTHACMSAHTHCTACPCGNRCSQKASLDLSADEEPSRRKTARDAAAPGGGHFRYRFGGQARGCQLRNLGSWTATPQEGRPTGCQVVSAGPDGLGPRRQPAALAAGLLTQEAGLGVSLGACRQGAGSTARHCPGLAGTIKRPWGTVPGGECRSGCGFGGREASSQLCPGAPGVGAQGTRPAGRGLCMSPHTRAGVSVCALHGAHV